LQRSRLSKRNLSLAENRSFSVGRRVHHFQFRTLDSALIVPNASNL
jgi:hypothetical protein